MRNRRRKNNRNKHYIQGDISNFEIEYQNILNQAVRSRIGLPTIPNQRLQNDIMIELKSSGLLNKLEGFWFFKGDGEPNFRLINWTNPDGEKAIEFNHHDFSWTNTGVTGNGLNFIDTRITPGGSTYALNDSSIWIEIVTESTGGASLFDASNNLLVCTKVAENSPAAIDSDNDNKTTFNINSAGVYTYNRDSSTNVSFHKDGVLVQDSLLASVVIPDVPYKILRNGSSGKGTAELGFFAFGSNITGSELDVHDSIINAPAVTNTGGIISKGIVDLVLTNNYGTRVGSVFTFNPQTSNIVEGITTDGIAKNNRKILNEALALSVAANDTEFIIGRMDAYFETETAQTSKRGMHDTSIQVEAANNYTLTLGDDTYIRQQPYAYQFGALLGVWGCTDFTLRGGNFIGDRYTHEYTIGSTGVQDSCINIVFHGVVNGLMEGVSTEKATGDGFISRSTDRRNNDGSEKEGDTYTKNLTLRRNYIYDNRRNGLAYTDCIGSIMENNWFHANCLDATETGQPNPPPQSDGYIPRHAIDFEPINTVSVNGEPGIFTELVQNVIIRNNRFTSNFKDVDIFKINYLDMYDNFFDGGSGSVVSDNVNIHDNVFISKAGWDRAGAISVTTYVLEDGVELNHTWHIYNNIITGYESPMKVAGKGHIIENNIVTEFSVKGLYLGGLLDGAEFNNNIFTSTLAGTKGMYTFPLSRDLIDVNINGGTFKGTTYSADINSVNGLGSGLTFDGTTFDGTVYIRNGSDNVTIQNSVYPAIPTDDGSNTNITLFNNNIGSELPEPLVNPISNFDIEYQNILNEAVSIGAILPIIADQRLQNDIVVEAKSNGLWTTAHVWYEWRHSGDMKFAGINWKNPTGVKLTEQGVGNMIKSSTGIKGDGTNYLTSGIIPSAPYTLNDASIWMGIAEDNSGAYVSFRNAGQVCTRVTGSGTFQYFNSNTNRGYSTASGTGTKIVTRNSNTDVQWSTDGVIGEVDSYVADLIPDEEYRFMVSGASSASDSEMSFVVVGGSVGGSEALVHSTMTASPSVTLTGGLNSSGYEPLTLSGVYGTYDSPTTTFTFDKALAEVTEGIVSDAVALNNKLIMNEAVRYAVEVEGANKFIIDSTDIFIENENFTAGREEIYESGIKLSYDNFTFEMGSTCHFRTQPNAGAYSAILGVWATTNITITGGNLHGDRYTHDYEFNGGIQDENDGIFLVGVKNSSVNNVFMEKFTGDGLVVRSTADRNGDGTEVVGEFYSDTIDIENNTFTDCRRNGFALTDCTNVEIFDNEVTFNGLPATGTGEINPPADSAGVTPRHGLDIEPITAVIDEFGNTDDKQVVQFVNIYNNNWNGNHADIDLYKGYDISIYDNTFESKIGNVACYRIDIYNNTFTRVFTEASTTAAINIKPKVRSNGVHWTKDWNVYGNTITGFGKGIAVGGENQNVHDNIINDCEVGIYLQTGKDNLIEDNTISSASVVGSEGVNGFVLGTDQDSVTIRGGTITTHGEAVGLDNIVGLNLGLVFDNITCIEDIRLEDCDNVTIQNSTFPEPIIQSGNTNITLTNNNTP